MAVSTKFSYPKAQPFHAPEELTRGLNEDLAAQVKRLQQANEELEKRAAHSRRWTLRLLGVAVVVVLLSSGVIGFVLQRGNVAAETAAVPLEVKSVPAASAIKKPDADFLEALGSLSSTHLYQSYLNIGLLADGVESETYTVEEAEQNLKAVVDMMNRVDRQHARLAKSALDPEDLQSLKQIQAISAMLQLQVAPCGHIGKPAAWNTPSSIIRLARSRGREYRR